MREYETIRRAERRGSRSADYYRALPFRDLTGRYAEDWHIRARSFQALAHNVLTRLQNPLERSLKILDLGAGNGWLSNRLAAQGDRVLAVDLSVNEEDGLGAWKYYEHSFTPVQAEFNRLPVMDRFADAVIFNSSFHYSENYAETLREALRVVTPDGRIIILDTPVYRRSQTGDQMVQERRAQFKEHFGLASDSLQSESYLTYARLRQLAIELKISWKYITPFYGLRWRLRPIGAALLRRRPPARFHVIVGRKT
jgi:SAM-dependent methyltransferase